MRKRGWWESEGVSEQERVRVKEREKKKREREWREREKECEKERNSSPLHAGEMAQCLLYSLT